MQRSSTSHRQIWSSPLSLVLVLLGVLAAEIVSGETTESLRSNETTRHSHSIRMDENAGIVEALFREYDRNVRPLGNVTVFRVGLRRPLVITIEPVIFRMVRIDDRKMEFSVNLALHMRWRDDRLERINGPQRILLNNPELIWKPNTYFQSSVVSALRTVTTVPSSVVFIDSDGTVTYYSELHVITSCWMRFEAFPFDYQKCDLGLRPFEYDAYDVDYKWKDGLFPMFDFESFCDSQYELWKVDAVDEAEITEAKFISNHRLSFYFRRSFGCYLYELYVPTAFLVVASWTAFFVQPSKVTARVIVGAVSLTALILLTCFMNMHFPIVHYIRFVDIWTGVLLLFVFAAFIETIVVVYFYSEKHKEYRNGQTGNNRNDLNSRSGKFESNVVNTPVLLRLYVTLSRNYLAIDHLARIVFPALFALFSLAYLLLCFNLPASAYSE